MLIFDNERPFCICGKNEKDDFKLEVRDIMKNISDPIKDFPEATCHVIQNKINVKEIYKTLLLHCLLHVTRVQSVIAYRQVLG